MTDLLITLENELVQARSLADCDLALSYYLNKKGLPRFHLLIMPIIPIQPII